MTTEITRRTPHDLGRSVAGAALVVPRRRTRAGQAAVGADRHFQSAARLRPGRAADDLLRRSGCPDDRSRIRRTHSGEHVDQAAVDRRALGRRPGVEQPGTIPAVERYPEQPSDALARRRRPGDGVPEPVEQQQRQHVRSQGRQLSCEHLTRRVVRYEHDGSITVIADAFQGKRLNSPNDVAVHHDGSIWFTDPPYGGQLYEGAPDASGGPTQSLRSIEFESRSAGGNRHVQARTADQRVSRRSERPHRSGHHGRSGARSQRHRVLARFQEALRREHREGPGRHRSPAAKAKSMRSTSAPTTRSRTESCSPIA